MEQSSRHPNSPLREVSSTLSDSSFGSNSTVVASPASPASYRPGYRRVPSAIEETVAQTQSNSSPQPSQGRHGLGITNLESHEEGTFAEVPMGSKNPQLAFSSADRLVSPTSTKLSGGTDFEGKGQDVRDEDQCLENTSTAQLLQPFTQDTGYNKAHLGFESRAFSCKSKGPLTTGRGSWVAVTILLLSIYSTVLSGLWLGIALARPRYDHAISPVGKITPATASVLYTAFAKSIELSFVTVFVALIGQILSKRALGDKKSITIAEMSMRSWVLQPGIMITHWHSVRYAMATYLGIFAILGATMAMIYTTASDALVAPKLQLGETQDRLIYGKVSTIFASSQSVQNICPTPIQPKDDKDHYGETCIEIQHSGEAYHNYMQYLAAWHENIATLNGSADLMKRPSPVAVGLIGSI